MPVSCGQPLLGRNVFLLWQVSVDQRNWFPHTDSTDHIILLLSTPYEAATRISICICVPIISMIFGEAWVSQNAPFLFATACLETTFATEQLSLQGNSEHVQGLGGVLPSIFNSQGCLRAAFAQKSLAQISK